MFDNLPVGLEDQIEPLELNPNAAHIDILGSSTDLDRPTLEAGGFVRRVCELADFGVEHLASRARDRETPGKRRLVATLGVERWRQKGKELAAVLNKNPDVVSWWVGEGAALRMEDPEFADQLDRMDQELARRVSKMTPSERLRLTS